jgi:hypothetical protein
MADGYARARGSSLFALGAIAEDLDGVVAVADGAAVERALDACRLATPIYPRKLRTR